MKAPILSSYADHATSLTPRPNFPAAYQRSEQRLALPYLNRTIMVSVDDIVCFQGEGNYTFVCTRDKKRYLLSKTLKEFEKTLDTTMFIRIHKSYIVNLAYTAYGDRERSLNLADGREVTISRRRLTEINKRLSQYRQRLLN